MESIKTWIKTHGVSTLVIAGLVGLLIYVRNKPAPGPVPVPMDNSPTISLPATMACGINEHITIVATNIKGSVLWIPPTDPGVWTYSENGTMLFASQYAGNYSVRAISYLDNKFSKLATCIVTVSDPNPIPIPPEPQPKPPEPQPKPPEPQPKPPEPTPPTNLQFFVIEVHKKAEMTPAHAKLTQSRNMRNKLAVNGHIWKSFDYDSEGAKSLNLQSFASATGTPSLLLMLKDGPNKGKIHAKTKCPTTEQGIYDFITKNGGSLSVSNEPETAEPEPKSEPKIVERPKITIPEKTNPEKEIPQKDYSKLAIIQVKTNPKNQLFFATPGSDSWEAVQGTSRFCSPELENPDIEYEFLIKAEPSGNIQKFRVKAGKTTNVEID